VTVDGSLLLERDSDLSALRALVDDGAAGNGRLLMIEGSAGIGKTRLLGEARSLAVGAGLRVLTARGGELEREFTFGLVRQLFEPLLATANVDERAEWFAGAAELSGPLFGGDVTEAPATDMSFAILHGLYWLAINVALGNATLLVLDDLHWGDAQSLRWLSYMARRLEGMPLVLATATRAPAHGDAAPLLDELLTDPTAMSARNRSLALSRSGCRASRLRRERSRVPSRSSASAPTSDLRPRSQGSIVPAAGAQDGPSGSRCGHWD
jgi:AAA ATPase domain